MGNRLKERKGGGCMNIWSEHVASVSMFVVIWLALPFCCS